MFSIQGPALKPVLELTQRAVGEPGSHQAGGQAAPGLGISQSRDTTGGRALGDTSGVRKRLVTLDNAPKN